MLPKTKLKKEDAIKKFKTMLAEAALKIVKNRKSFLEAVDNKMASSSAAPKMYMPRIGSEDIARVNEWFWEGKSSKGGPIGKEGERAAWANGDTLYSYGTAIAKYEGNVVYLNSMTYTHTTGKVKKYIKELVNLVKEGGDNIKIEMVPQSYFKTSMPKVHAPKWMRMDWYKKFPFLKFD
jgi:hypothetical protein